ncbi:MAG TPA: homoserine dehydrogenase [Vicinamibacterales bacterium]|nr:homoserine dehydrogenase [Vicinamibacterales bacterium]
MSISVLGSPPGARARTRGPASPAARAAASSAPRVALLGCGTVGSALVRLLDAADSPPVRLAAALVRDARRQRALPPSVPLVSDSEAVFAARPAVLVEVLGGTAPARELVLRALEGGTPVVTANKTLLARHGRELREAAARSGAPLLYEAAVIAGVPFLGAFARRPLAAAATGLSAIVNGTTNFVLTACADDGRTVAEALASAQALGYAEPDPHNDVAGIDAAEKLAVLLQHFAHLDVSPDAIETEGIGSLDPETCADARALGGCIKPVVHADWSGRLEAFVAPAFVPDGHPLAAVAGVENALILETPRGRLLFQGPGAGPDATAATVLDDVAEVIAGAGWPIETLPTAAAPAAPDTGWMVTLTAPRLPRPASLADLFASYGVYTQRVAPVSRRGPAERLAFLTSPVDRRRLEAALRAARQACGCASAHRRALEASR